MRISPLPVALAVGAGLLAAPANANEPLVHKTSTLPEVAVGDFQNGLIPLGANEYWTVSDRGPNGEVGDARTFLVPDFTPTLVRIKVQEPDFGFVPRAYGDGEDVEQTGVRTTLAELSIR